MNSALKTISSYMAQEIISILRIDLRENTVRIVKASKRINNDYYINLEDDYVFSEMIADFVQSGYVHVDDIEKVRRESDIEYLRERFSGVTEDQLSSTKFSYVYRRMVGDRFRPVMVSAVPTAYFTTHHPIIYVYVQHINVDPEEYATKAIPTPVVIPSTSSNTPVNQIILSDNENQHSINALASIYMSLYIVDIANNNVMQFSGSKNFGGNVIPCADAIAQLQHIIRNNIEPRFRARALAFTDLSTLSDRMLESNLISTELVGTTVGWFRMQFIAISRDSAGNIQKAFFSTQVIDKEKRREEKLIKNSITDELTGLYNRHAFENDIIGLKKHKLPSDLVIVSVDVNELKKANDSLGHQAGDELICGAADALISTINNGGRVYRTGGDEFTIILFCDADMVDAYIADIKNNVAEWKGAINSTLSLSCGAAGAAEFPGATFEDLLSESDRRMYADKSRYYVESGKDRRHH